MYNTFEDVLEEANNELEHFGLYDWNVQFNYKYSRTLGTCHVLKKTIYISALFCHWKMQDNPRVIRDVILHEIAHALDWVRNKQCGHGTTWVQCCNLTGANPNRFVDIQSIRPR